VIDMYSESYDSNREQCSLFFTHNDIISIGMDEKNFRKTIKELRVAIAAIDVVLFTIIEGDLFVFLSSVHRPPYY